MNLNLKNKVAVVSAASRGLGEAVAESLASEGANIIICARNWEQLNSTATRLRNEYKVSVTDIVCDVTYASDVENLRNKVVEEYGTCHILFTNAGGPPAGKVGDFSTDDYRGAIELNLLSTISLVNTFLPLMVNQNWGRIIASTSSNIRYLLPQFPLSNVSRIAVVSYIKNIASEYSRFNITANVVAPGLFLTDPTINDIKRQAGANNISYEEMLRRVAATIPVQQIGDPKDFGALVSFIASEYTSFLTGETFLIDGGKYCGVI